jgi:poly(3-hydroxyalkanoate) synthetase
MISKKVNQLVQDIFRQIPLRAVHRETEEEPEAHLISLLEKIKEDLESYRKHRVPLYSTVEQACYEVNVKKAREELEGLHESVA